MTTWRPVLPPSLRDAITRQDDLVPATALDKASRREAGRRIPYALLAIAVGAAGVVTLLVLVFVFRI